MKSSRKIIAFITGMAAAFSWGACTGGGSSSDTPKKKLAPIEDLADYSAYSLKTWLKPFWYTREVYNETVMFVGENDEAKLLYDAEDIISVTSYGLDVEYKKGEDYKYENGILSRTENSSIPFWNKDEYYLKTPGRYIITVDNEKAGLPDGDVRYLAYGEQDTFTKKQISVTYTHSQEWKGPVPQGKSEKFVKTLEKIKNGEKTRVLFYGDSITTGCNASGLPQGGEISPYTPSFAKMFCDYLGEKYNNDKIELINTAVGGKAVSWGVSEIEDRVLGYSPDIVVIGFGMNDVKTSPDVFKNSTELMVKAIKKKNPDAEIMLIATMLPNYEATSDWNYNQKLFVPKLLELEEKYGFVGVANVTEMHQALFDAGKRYRDVTGNNINHPNDFVVRLYAQVLLKTMLGTDFVNEVFE